MLGSKAKLSLEKELKLQPGTSGSTDSGSWTPVDSGALWQGEGCETGDESRSEATLVTNSLNDGAGLSPNTLFSASGVNRV